MRAKDRGHAQLSQEDCKMADYAINTSSLKDDSQRLTATSRCTRE